MGWPNRWGGWWSRPRWTARLALIGLLPVLLVASVGARPPSDRLAVAGRSFFLAGVNYPWKTGQDFGTGAWGHSGVSSPTTYAEVDTDFANMAAQGVRVAKWRVFGDGRYSPEFDAAGFPTGLDEHFFRDVDAALEIARRHNVYLVLVLFDSGFWTADCKTGGVHLGGHADVLVDPARRQALVERVLVPFFRHVARSDRVISYEVLAEPDWGVRELHTDEDGRLKVSLAQVRAFVRGIVGAIRAESSALVTVEANRSRNLGAWRGLGLDYYSFSWYDWLEPYDPLDTAAAAFGLDRPVVLGEFPVRSAEHDLPVVLDIAWNRGYAGAFAWSFTGVDRSGALVDEGPAYLSWLRSHWPVVHLFAPPPSAQPSLLPLPYALREVRLRGVGAGLAIEAELSLRDREKLTARLFATRVGQTDPTAEVKVAASPDASGQVTVRATMTSLAENQPYKLSLGLFGPDGRLLKWFDAIAYAELSNGAVHTPELSALALENPCHG